MIYVVAFVYRDATEWARREGLQPNQWRYIGEHYDLHGLRNPTVALVSRWYMRKDVNELEALLQMIGAVQYESEKLGP